MALSCVPSPSTGESSLTHAALGQAWCIQCAGDGALCSSSYTFAHVSSDLVVTSLQGFCCTRRNGGPADPLYNYASALHLLQLHYLAPMYALSRKRWELPAFIDTKPACNPQVMATTGGVSARLAPPSLPLTCQSTMVRRSRHSSLQRSCRSLFLRLQLLHSAQHLQALLTPPC